MSLPFVCSFLHSLAQSLYLSLSPYLMKWGEKAKKPNECETSFVALFLIAIAFTHSQDKDTDYTRTHILAYSVQSKRMECIDRKFIGTKEMNGRRRRETNDSSSDSRVILCTVAWEPIASDHLHFFFFPFKCNSWHFKRTPSNLQWNVVTIRSHLLGWFALRQTLATT